VFTGRPSDLFFIFCPLISHPKLRSSLSQSEVKQIHNHRSTLKTKRGTRVCRATIFVTLLLLVRAVKKLYAMELVILRSFWLCAFSSFLVPCLAHFTESLTFLSLTDCTCSLLRMMKLTIGIMSVATLLAMPKATADEPVSTSSSCIVPRSNAHCSALSGDDGCHYCESIP
jgi:hypothetical protein